MKEFKMINKEIKNRQDELIKKYAVLINKLIKNRAKNSELIRAKIIGDYLEKDSLNEATLNLIDIDIENMINEF